MVLPSYIKNDLLTGVRCFVSSEHIPCGFYMYISRVNPLAQCVYMPDVVRFYLMKCDQMKKHKTEKLLLTENVRKPAECLN